MTDSIVTPENTKKIAEWAGYHAEILNDKPDYIGSYVPYNKSNVYIRPAQYKMHMLSYYNPITNAEQSREVLEKLLILGWKVAEYGGIINMKILRTGFGKLIKAETLELAIYKASLQEAEK